MPVITKRGRRGMGAGGWLFVALTALVASAPNASAAGDQGIFGTWKRNQSLSKAVPAELEPPEVTVKIGADGQDGLVYEWHYHSPDGLDGGYTVRAGFDGIQKFRDGDVGTMLFWRTPEGGFWDGWHLSDLRRGFEICTLQDGGKKLQCEGSSWDAQGAKTDYVNVFDRVK